MPDGVSAAQELFLKVDIDLQLRGRILAVQQPASDPRGADVIDVAEDALSQSPLDRWPNSVAKTTKKFSERVFAHRSD